MANYKHQEPCLIVRGMLLMHTVFVDGAKVVDAGRMTTIDEDTFHAR